MFFNLHHWLIHNKTPKDITDRLGIFPNIPENGNIDNLFKHDFSWIKLSDIVSFPLYTYDSYEINTIHNIEHKINSVNLQVKLYIYNNSKWRLISGNDYNIKIIDNENIQVELNSPYRIKIQLLNFD